ncbi:phage holin family protein [Ochrovirga pacifica]|uniref:phage holin family protein n=1 Tax=Ochrovirga pacifica TaxID=1042376 RepID=UPI0002558ED9|nr:phage holin family protein [Ochrovirga pacifica]
MKKYIVQLLVNAIAVYVIAAILPGAYVSSYWIAILVAFGLSLLNLVVKPLLVIFTLPITLLTLGLFLLVINAIIIKMADGLITGFDVHGFFTALFFSLLLSFLQSLLHGMFGLKED